MEKFPDHGRLHEHKLDSSETTSVGYSMRERRGNVRNSNSRSLKLVFIPQDLTVNFPFAYIVSSKEPLDEPYRLDVHQLDLRSRIWTCLYPRKTNLAPRTVSRYGYRISLLNNEIFVFNGRHGSEEISIGEGASPSQLLIYFGDPARYCEIGVAGIIAHSQKIINCSMLSRCLFSI